MKYLQPKITFFEMPVIQLKDNNGNAITPLRTKDPKLAQIQLAGSLRQSLPIVGISPEIKFVDLSAMNPENKIMYGTINYGGKIINKYRIGANFDDVKSIVNDTDIISITANFTMVAGIVKDFIEWVKEKNPVATVIIGGTDATQRPDYYLRCGSDYIVHGEGELILNNLIEAILKQKDVAEISGISFIRGNKKITNKRTAIDTPSLELTAFPALDLSYPYSESCDGAPVEGVMAPMALLESSRGCNHKCSFCVTARTKGQYRYIPPQKMTQLLKHYKNSGINTVLFADDNILSRLDFKKGRDATIRLFRDLREMGFAWEYFNGIEISKLIMGDGTIDHELIDILFSHEYVGNRFVGCYRSYIPLENLRDDTPNKISKFRTLVNFDNVLDFKLELKIIREILKTRLPMIGFGLLVCTPDEHEDFLELNRKRCIEIKEMIHKENSTLIDSLKTRILFHVFTQILLPGTPDYDKHMTRIAFSYDEYPELSNFITSVINGSNFAYYEMFAEKVKLSESINDKEIIDSFRETGNYLYTCP